jgi:hypothetical protein
MGLIDSLSALPLWLLAIVLNVWLVGLALVGLWIARRWILPRLQLTYDDAYFAAAVVQSAMLLYSLIAALTAVGVWQRYTQVADVVSGEATAIATLWRDLDGYPQPARDATQGILRGYTEQIINEAWPQQRRGEIPHVGVDWMDRLQAELFSFEPATEAQKILHAQALSAYSQLIQERRQRLDSVQGGLPVVLWYLLLPGAAGCIALFIFFHLANPRFQDILLVGLAGFLSMVLFVIIALDRPFRGDAGIGPDSYQLVYDHQMRK